MSTVSRIALAIVTLMPLVGAGPARAEEARIAIIGVRNDAGGAVAGELAKALCGRFECAPRAKVMAGARIDFAAARKEGVDALLFGTVQGTGQSRALALALLRRSMQPEKTWRIPLDARGGLSAPALAAVQRDLAALGAARAPATVEERPAAPPVQEPVAAAPEPEARRAVRPVPAPTPTPASARPGPSRRTEASTPRRDGLAAVDLGVWAVQRRLTYQGVGATSSTLRDFRGGTIVAPAVRAELYPLAGGERWYAGFGLYAGYARSVGFKTEESPSGVEHDTVLSALDVGAAWRSPRLGSMGLLLTPSVGFRQLAFKASGSGIPGLPDAALAGVGAGIAAELPIGARFALLASGGYVLWTSKGDLVGDPFFKDGSAAALQAELGLEARLAGAFSLRVTGTFEQTTYSLDSSAAFTATGATDRYAGARAALRARF